MADVPTGDDSSTISDYYDHLYDHYVSQITQTFDINPITLLWWAFYVFVLVTGVYAATRWQRNTRARREPYPVETYNGYISETNGPVGVFLSLFIVGIVAFLIVITVFHLIQGQIY